MPRSQFLRPGRSQARRQPRYLDSDMLPACLRTICFACIRIYMARHFYWVKTWCLRQIDDLTMEIQVLWERPASGTVHPWYRTPFEKCQPMPINSFLKIARNSRALFAIFAYFVMGAAFALSQAGDQAGQLRSKYQSLAPQFKQNQFNQPLVLESTDASNGSAGDIWAVTDHSFANFESTFSDPDNWCDVLILHLNTKYCRPSAGQAGPSSRAQHRRQVAGTFEQEFIDAVCFSSHNRGPRLL